MATICGGMARGRVMRLTRLDACGTPVVGACSTLVTDGFILVTDTANYQDPEDITQTNANGELCVDDQSDPALRWLDLEIQLCNVDPNAINFMTGDPLVLDDAGTPNTVGYRIDSALTGSANFALEVWSGVPGTACVGTFQRYGYHLFPWVKQATFGERSVQNGPYTITLNARTQAGSPWGVGPYPNVRRDAAVPATLEALLTPITATQQYHFEFSTAPLPVSACGCIALA